VTNNPYAQVALTYVRRPFSSWLGGLASVVFIGVFVGFSFLGHAGLKDSWATQLMFLFSLFIFLALHMKRQFVDSRAHLMPGYRRVHATVVAIAALVVTVILPTGVSWFMGWNCIGFVAVVMLLFGTVLWVNVNDATWALFAMMAGWTVLCSTQSGPAWFRELLAGHIEAQAVAILVLGILITLLAGVQLVRLNADMLTCYSTVRWDRSQKTRQGSSDNGRILPGLMDWIREREMARLTRMARQASTSRWSAVYRWRVGMPNGWTSWLFGVGVVIAVEFTAWVTARGPDPSVFFWLFLIGLIACPSVMSLSQLISRNYLLGYEIMLPVERRTYLRELVMAFAVSQLRIWGGMYAGFMLWWFTAAQERLQFGLMANVLACSALAQVGLFGVGLCIISWAKPHSPQMVITAFGAIMGALVSALIAWTATLRGVSPLPALRGSLWPLACAGLFAMFGLLLTWLAYRRWLVRDFD
jgi:hypothetical protein